MEDMFGKEIEVGDIVIYTRPGAGRGLPPLAAGEVHSLTKASVKVYTLNKDMSRTQSQGYYEDKSSAPYYTDSNGKEYYHTKGDGIFRDSEPVAIKHYKDRFYIARKV